MGSHWENEVKVPGREGPNQLSCEAGARLSGEYCAHEGGPQGFLCPSRFSPPDLWTPPPTWLCVWGGLLQIFLPRDAPAACQNRGGRRETQGKGQGAGSRVPVVEEMMAV